MNGIMNDDECNDIKIISAETSRMSNAERKQILKLIDSIKFIHGGGYEIVESKHCEG